MLQKVRLKLLWNICIEWVGGGVAASSEAAFIIQESKHDCFIKSLQRAHVGREEVHKTDTSAPTLKVDALWGHVCGPACTYMRHHCHPFDSCSALLSSGSPGKLLAPVLSALRFRPWLWRCVFRLFIFTKKCFPLEQNNERQHYKMEPYLKRRLDDRFSSSIPVLFSQTMSSFDFIYNL